MITTQQALDIVKNLGKILDYNYQGPHIHVRNMFWSTFKREMFKQMYRSFEVRSLGGTDDLGGSWHPLKEKTVKIKSRFHRRRRKTIPPAKNPRQINVDTGDLLKSFFPGKIVKGAYMPPNRNQSVRREGRGLRLGSKLDYGPKVDKERNLFRRNQTKWVHHALRKAVEAVIPLLKH